MKHLKLDAEPKINSGFIIPANYFETFSQKLQPKLLAKPTKIILISAWIKQNKSWIISSAAILFLSTSTLLYTNFKQNNSTKYAAEIENYITKDPTYSDDDIVNLLNSEEIKAIQLDSKLNNETIENHLIENPDLEQIITN